MREPWLISDERAPDAVLFALKRSWLLRLVLAIFSCVYALLHFPEINSFLSGHGNTEKILIFSFIAGFIICLWHDAGRLHYPIDALRKKGYALESMEALALIEKFGRPSVRRLLHKEELETLPVNLRRTDFQIVWALLHRLES